MAVLIGSSGCGKTTTLKMINRLIEPTSGKIYINGKDIAAQDRVELRRHIGYVIQQIGLFPNMTVAQNICVVPNLLKYSKEACDKIVHELLELVNLPYEQYAHKYPSEMSGGQQQRIGILRALAASPPIVLMDEPFSALDSYLKYQLELELAETLSGFPGTVLWVSHDRGEVFRNCRRVCVIDRGRSQPVTTLGELFRSPGTEAAARLSGCKNYADARPREDAVFLPDWGLTLSCGRPVPEGVCRIGIRAHHVQLAGPGAENAFSCTAVKVVEDVFSTIVLLRPEGAAPEAPLLRMELDKDNWQAVPDKDRLTVSVPPEAILLLES